MTLGRIPDHFLDEADLEALVAGLDKSRCRTCRPISTTPSRSSTPALPAPAPAPSPQAAPRSSGGCPGGVCPRK